MNTIEQLHSELINRLGLPPDQAGLAEPDSAPDSFEEEVVLTDPNDSVETLKVREYGRSAASVFTEGRLHTYGPIESEVKEGIEGAVRHIGFEVLAFYKSIRNCHADPYPGKWGIFYREPGIAYIEDCIQAYYPGTTGDKSLLALEFLRQHERFHYMFDVYAMKMESAIGKHLYLPMKQAFVRHRTQQVEEALANRQAWQWSKKPSVGFEDFAYDFMKLQPNAYARFDDRELSLKSELAANLIDHDLSHSAGRDDQAPWVAVLPAYLLRKTLCPEYVVQPASLSRFISPAVVIPPVRKVSEDKQVQKLLAKKYRSLKRGWEATKELLLREPSLLSLNFKPWLKAGRDIWSVRVKSSSNNFRAHLRHLGNGEWVAIEFGPHKAMGHG